MSNGTRYTILTLALILALSSPLTAMQEQQYHGCLPPLHTACMMGNLQEVRRLIGTGADVCETERDPVVPKTPLYTAALFDHTEIVIELLKAGAKAYVQDEDANPLFWAAHHNNTVMGGWLIAYGGMLDEWSKYYDWYCFMRSKMLKKNGMLKPQYHKRCSGSPLTPKSGVSGT